MFSLISHFATFHAHALLLRWPLRSHRICMPSISTWRTLPSQHTTSGIIKTIKMSSTSFLVLKIPNKTENLYIVPSKIWLILISADLGRPDRTTCTLYSDFVNMPPPLLVIVLEVTCFMKGNWSVLTGYLHVLCAVWWKNGRNGSFGKELLSYNYVKPIL